MYLTHKQLGRKSYKDFVSTKSSPTNIYKDKLKSIYNTNTTINKNVLNM